MEKPYQFMRYASEKYMSAVERLATRPGSLVERIRSAVLEIGPLSGIDGVSDAATREGHASVLTAYRHRHADLDEATAARIAKKIFDVHLHIDRVVAGGVLD